ncbi:MAG: hypothetical protein EBY38_02940 [Flavobacteriaceae bacterium]|nr:hypothetical protein [Flavobacteriaceae bacterium]
MTMKCPKVIAEAMFSVQKQVKKLAHDSKNDFQSYNYVSIDAYYEAVRPWLNQAGLMIIPNEEEAAISPDGKTFKVRFAFIVMHESGEVWEVPIKRTVYLQYGGAQSCGSALSYAEKFVMRTLFKIPTGEYDPEQDQPVREVEQTEKTVIVDADATSKPKQGQDSTIDYNYNDAPFRIFDKNNAVLQAFTEIKPWGMMLKNRLSKTPELYEANRLEIERVIRDVKVDPQLTEKARTNLLTSLENLTTKEA